jgi:hypothetical protein
MVKLVEVIKGTTSYDLREVFINPKHVVYLREDTTTKRHLTEGKFPDDLDVRQTFTKVYVDNGTTGTEFVVVGGPTLIESKLKGKTLING